MVQTRSNASGRVSNGGGAPLQDSTLEPEALPPSDDNPPPTKKWRRDEPDSQKKRRRRQREELCQLNFDVLFLIAEYIHPMDLLNLARTCKSLRVLLMDKSSEFIWRTARRQEAGLPDCPPDLTEPEYANLVFCARCHSCGKPARTVLWNLRRRYCPKCKPERLCKLSSCDDSIRFNGVLAVEKLDGVNWVDKEQMESILDEYRQSADKWQFAKTRNSQCFEISLHVDDCESWQQTKALERRGNLASRRNEREKSILERLKQQGYAPEIEYFRCGEIRNSNKVAFRTSKPLTNKEWDLMWPVWHKIMDRFRSRRMDEAVYSPRLQLLKKAYQTYVKHQLPDGQTLDILPHLNNLTCFGPFRDVIMAPEETEVNDAAFVPAFAQLPNLLGEWRHEVDISLSELVKIPHLSTDHVPDGQDKTSSDTEHTRTSEADLGKLYLACAVFFVDGVGCFTHLDALSVFKRKSDPGMDELVWANSIKHMQEAPYIVRACGLDPTVATADDMDRRNARLKCLCCKNYVDTIMDWRSAMWHVGTTFHTGVLSKVPHWELVHGEHIDETHAAIERDIDDYMRCLLCRRHVGDALSHDYGNLIATHFAQSHGISHDELKEGVHYVYLGIRDSPKRC